LAVLAVIEPDWLEVMLEEAAWGKKPTLFEYWGHEASLLPMALQPLFRWRMERARAGERSSWAAGYRRPLSQVLRMHNVPAEFAGSAESALHLRSSRCAGH
jgi:uncharacterized protein YcaQ